MNAKAGTMAVMRKILGSRIVSFLVLSLMRARKTTLDLFRWIVEVCCV